MVKALLFKGDVKPKKRKARPAEDAPQSDIRPEETNLEDGSWVTAEVAESIKGPVLLVTQTPRPSCFMCDANGKVALSRLENMIEGDRTTAEPHDLRQVWVASQLAGTGKISFKGHHGRYLGCSERGFIAADGDAISPQESFSCVMSGKMPGAFVLQNDHGYCMAYEDDSKEPRVCGMTDAGDQQAAIVIRMQARFQPRLQADKAERVRAQISRQELEATVGRKLADDEVRTLKRARRHGNYHEALLDVKVKTKHDKFS